MSSGRHRGDRRRWTEWRSSRIERVPTETGDYRVVVSSYRQGGEGLAEISITHSGGSRTVFASQLFGGWRVRNKVIVPGDVLLADNSPDDSVAHGLHGQPAYHDTTMFFMGWSSTECDPGQGLLRCRPNETRSLSRRTTDETITQPESSLTIPS